MSSHIPYPSSKPLNPDELIQQCANYHAFLEKRRSLRFFSDHPVPREAVEQLIMAASSAPSGANKQPWTFCAVGSLELKKQIREAAEEEEYRSYHGRMAARPGPLRYRLAQTFSGNRPVADYRLPANL